MPFANQRLLYPLALAALCLGFVFAVWALHPTCFFGLTHDDMLYFTSAQAIAQHQGYVLPSLPGAPPASKYPILYPWLLSWVWRWNPTFPANLTGIIWLNLVFGLIFVLAASNFLRHTEGLSTTEVLLLTAFLAFQPWVLFYTSVTMAEIPFAALAFTGLLLADTAMHRTAPRSAGFGCGLVLGLAILIRTAGVPLALAVLLVALFRRAWKQAVAFALAFAPFFVALFWRTILLVPPPATAFSSSAPGWRQAWLYHTDYVAFRTLASPDLHMVGQFVLNQLIYFPAGIAGYFLSPLMDGHILFWSVATIFVFCTVLIGWIRLATRSQWAPLHVAAVLYVLSLISWDYPDWQRFMLIFLPVILASVWLQGKQWFLQALATVRRGAHSSERVLAVSTALLLLSLFLAACYNFAGLSRGWAVSKGKERQRLSPEKQEAYSWFSHNARQGDRVIAMEDGSLYLYTGLQSMVPIVPLPGGIYDAKQVRSDMDHMMDVAQAIGARYWMSSVDDYDGTQKFFRPFLMDRAQQLQSVLTPVFRSSQNNIVIYDLSCVREPSTPRCRNALPILFPEGIPDYARPKPETSRSVASERRFPID